MTLITINGKKITNPTAQAIVMIFVVLPVMALVVFLLIGILGFLLPIILGIVGLAVGGAIIASLLERKKCKK